MHYLPSKTILFTIAIAIALCGWTYYTFVFLSASVMPPLACTAHYKQLNQSNEQITSSAELSATFWPAANSVRVSGIVSAEKNRFVVNRAAVLQPLFEREGVLLSRIKKIEYASDDNAVEPYGAGLLGREGEQMIMLFSRLTPASWLVTVGHDHAFLCSTAAH